MEDTGCEFNGDVLIQQNPQRNHTNLSIDGSLISLDIGATLVKVAYILRESKELFEGWTKELLYEDTVECHMLGGQLHFVRFETKHLNEWIEFVHSKQLFLGARLDGWLPNAPTGDARIKATGGGAHKYAEVFRKRIGINFDKLDEIASAVAGANFLLQYIDHEAFTHMNGKKTFVCIDRNDLFPYLLVNIGTGVSIIKVTGPTRFERETGIHLGGGTIFGLGRLLTGCCSYGEFLELSQHGDNRALDLTVGDIYGERGYPEHNLSASAIASSFGKVNGNKKLSEYKVEDVAAAVLKDLTYVIALVSYLVAKNLGLKRMYFGGSYIGGNASTMDHISYGLNYWSKGQVEAVFLQHEGFLGAIGALLHCARTDVDRLEPHKFNGQLSSSTFHVGLEGGNVRYKEISTKSSKMKNSEYKWSGVDVNPNIATNHSYLPVEGFPLSLDIGGTLVKVVYLLKDNKKLFEGWTKELFYDDKIECHKLGGMLHFVRFETKYLNEWIEFVHSKHLLGTKVDCLLPQASIGNLTIKATGGGAIKYAEVFRKKLGITFVKVDEIASVVAGANFLLRETDSEAFTHINGKKTFVCADLNGLFPYLLVNIGSGVSIIKVNGPQSFRREIGIHLGGGTIFGLGRLLTNCQSYDELLELSRHGDNHALDLTVGDIYGELGYPEYNLPASAIASSFGKVNGNTKLSEYKAEDLAATLLKDLTYIIAQVAYLVAKHLGLKRIYFGGSYIRGNASTMDNISQSLNYWLNFLSINRFERKKNIDLAVSAFAMLQTLKEPAVKLDDATLTIVGGYDKRLKENVEYLEELKSLAEREGVSDWIRFITSCSTAERNAVLSECLSVIYTPMDEHFGIVPLEAMAAQKPAIGCNSGGPVEIVKDGVTGFLCDTTPQGSSMAMAKLIQDPQMAKRMGQETRQHVTELFSTNTLVSI